MTRPPPRTAKQLLLLPPRASRLAGVATKACAAAVALQDDESSSKRIVTFSCDPPTVIPSYWQDYEEVQSLSRHVWWTKAERTLFGKTTRTLAGAYQGAAKMTPPPSSTTTTCIRRPLLLHQRKVHRQLQDAIEDAQFEAHYQPKAAAATITPLYLPWTVRGLEALICPILCRWRRQHVHGALALSDSDDNQTMADWCRQSSRPCVLLAQRLAVADSGQTFQADTVHVQEESTTTTTTCLPPRVVSPETIPPEEKDTVVPPRQVGLFAPDGRKRPRAGCSLLEHPQRRLRRRLLWVR